MAPACRNLLYDEFFLVRVRVLLEDDALRSELVGNVEVYAKGAISTLAPRVGLSAIRGDESMRAAAGDISDAVAKHLLDQHRRALLKNLLVADSQLAAAVAAHGINVLLRRHKGRVLIAASHELDGDAVKAETGLRQIECVDTAAILLVALAVRLTEA